MYKKTFFMNNILNEFIFQSAYSRGGSTIPKIDDSVFEEDDELNMGVPEDYYEDDDD